ncbi:Uncharacterized protein OS=Escherichia coli HM605 GN=ECHM605_12271 PE=4 SV=1 [Gemmata massiliana]|uniref:Uncharacterized protein n=1 Tax=Gemmata massiliana TaxID=1210884 RepID=A0A6P2D4H9_9BACT|nr:hypothetical protein [Gemmata massiliana]VTR94362.1 Uncharacterized protein OS=Escherichia coli HM605 GN=ECHM605_12271 PE=4 SV=1 [Gemmata massiliana]
MKFVCIERCELPFAMNLPPDAYNVSIGGAAYALALHQGWVAAIASTGQWSVGPEELAVRALAKITSSPHIQRLRPVICHTTTREIADADLPVLTESEAAQEMFATAFETFDLAAGSNAMHAEANRRRAAMSADRRVAYDLALSKTAYARRLADRDLFLQALNALIRLYMQRFDDFFVEQVSISQLSFQYPLVGVQAIFFCDGEELTWHDDVGRFPGLARTPWLNLPSDDVARFKEDLGNGVQPNAVELLEVRARSFLNRDVTRSAIIETSAALDLSLGLKIREGYAKQGKTEKEIESTLNGAIQFETRANRLMREATGKELSKYPGAQKLYERVVDHRKKYRHGIAHADVEPVMCEAGPAVNDFQELRRIVDGVSI